MTIQSLGTGHQSADPVLALRELGFDDTTGEFKIGDGSSRWSTLTAVDIPGSGGSGASGLWTDLGIGATRAEWAQDVGVWDFTTPGVIRHPNDPGNVGTITAVAESPGWLGLALACDFKIAADDSGVLAIYVYDGTLIIGWGVEGDESAQIVKEYGPVRSGAGLATAFAVGAWHRIETQVLGPYVATYIDSVLVQRLFQGASASNIDDGITPPNVMQLQAQGDVSFRNIAAYAVTPTALG